MLTHEGDARAHYHVQHRRSWPGLQLNERIRIPRGNVNHNAHEADPFGGICGAHEGYETAEVRDVQGIDGGRRLREGPGKKGVWGVSWTTSELWVFTPTTERPRPKTRGNGARRRNKGRNVS